MIFSKKQLEWVLEIGFFLSPKLRSVGKIEQAQKVLKMTPFPKI